MPLAQPVAAEPQPRQPLPLRKLSKCRKGDQKSLENESFSTSNHWYLKLRGKRAAFGFRIDDNVRLWLTQTITEDRFLLQGRIIRGILDSTAENRTDFLMLMRRSLRGVKHD
jgi:hypothetical protein